MSHCRVHLLDESMIDIGVDLHGQGRQLLENVCEHLNVVEVDYFGLKYKGEDYDGIWVRMNKPIKKQFPLHRRSWEFVFAVKYYPTDPTYLKEETTKYQLCLQIRENLVNQKLHCPLSTLITLSSYWLQSEFGDGDEASIEVKQYLGSLKLRLGERQSDPDFAEKVEQLYKSRSGMLSADADALFLDHATTLPLYGFHFYDVKNEEAEEIRVGIGSKGIYELKGKEQPVKYRWSSIKNINYRKEKFLLKLSVPKTKKHSNKKIYHLKSYVFAKAMWRNAVDQHIFFRASHFDQPSDKGASRTRKPKEITKRKSKLSVAFSFRKKEPKTEVEVREESAKIRRPNPSVVRTPSLKKPVITKSEISSPMSSDVKDFNEKHKLSKVTSTSTKSILKKQESSKEKSSKEKSGPESNETETRKQGLRIDNLQTDETISKDSIPPASSLLLTTTIVEEDEELESLRRSSSSSKPSSSTATSNLDPHSPVKSSLPSTPEVIVTDCNKDKSPFPDVTSNDCDEARRLSVEVNVDSKHSRFLPPPLLSQSTREAILPYVNSEKHHATENASTTQENSDESEKKDKNGPCDVEAPDPISNPQSSTELPTEEKDFDDFEDDRRTIRSISHVAVHEDDDATIKEFVDDILMDDVVESIKDSLNDNESRITESSNSSVSNLTDNTEELCNPNILEIIWAKSQAGRECGYREIFGVKLRKIGGRRRNVQSTFLNLTQQESVGTQVPTPPLPNGSKNGEENESKRPFIFSNGRKYIPSWPFDPDSLAHRVELDELDREAIKAALKAQSELKNKSGLEGASVLNCTLINVEKTESEPDISSKSEMKAETTSEKANDNSFPAIPDFCQSVLKNKSDSIDTEQTRKLLPTETLEIDALHQDLMDELDLEIKWRHKVESDELDREPIKATVKAESGLRNETDLNGVPLVDCTLINVEKTESEPDVPVKSEMKAETTSEKANNNSLPPIPDFCQSVLKNKSDSSEAEQTRELPSTETLQVAALPQDLTSNLKKSTNFIPKPLVEESKSIPLLSQKESLIFPPDIHIFPNEDKNSDLLIYHPTPDQNRFNKESLDEITAVVKLDSDVITQLLDVKLEKQDDEPTEIIQDETKKINFTYTQQMSRDIVESGRSTPSSVSSFPRFVHSVFPLREMSTNWGSVSTEENEDREDSTVPQTGEKSEASSTVSNFSVKSVKGSSTDPLPGALAELNFSRSWSIAETLSTQVTTVESTNDTGADMNKQENSVSTSENRCSTPDTDLSLPLSSEVDLQLFEYSSDFVDETSSNPPSSSTLETEKSVEVSSNPLNFSDDESYEPPSSEFSLDLSTLSSPECEQKQASQEAIMKKQDAPKEPGPSRGQQDADNDHESCTLHYQPSNFLISSDELDPVKMYDVEDNSLPSDSDESHENAFINPSDGANTQKS